MTGKKKNIRRILKGFQEIDELYFDFEDKLIDCLYDEIAIHYPSFKYNHISDLEFKYFANQAFNTTESVIDKDFNYPIYRIRKELFIMQKLAEEKDQSNKNHDFFLAISKHLKRLSVDFFPKVFNLSSNGFLLLDTNINYVTYVFLEWFFNNHKDFN